MAHLEVKNTSIKIKTQWTHSTAGWKRHIVIKYKIIEIKRRHKTLDITQSEQQRDIYWKNYKISETYRTLTKVFL